MLISQNFRDRSFLSGDDDIVRSLFLSLSLRGNLSVRHLLWSLHCISCSDDISDIGGFNLRAYVSRLTIN